MKPAEASTWTTRSSPASLCSQLRSRRSGVAFILEVRQAWLPGPGSGQLETENILWASYVFARIASLHCVQQTQAMKTKQTAEHRQACTPRPVAAPKEESKAISQFITCAVEWVGTNRFSTGRSSKIRNVEPRTRADSSVIVSLEKCLMELLSLSQRSQEPQLRYYNRLKDLLKDLESRDIRRMLFQERPLRIKQ